MNPKMKHRLMNEAGGDGGGTGGGAVDAAAASAPAPAAGQAAAPSVLSAAAPAPAWQAPDKYLTKNAEGAVDWEATARKIDEGRSHLEKRFGSGDVPPQDVAGYKLAVPETYAETLKGWDPAKDEKLTAFLGNAHKVGFTQPQLDLVLGEFGRVMTDVQASSAPNPEALAETAAASLREVWKEQGSFDSNVGLAFKATSALAQKAGVSMDEIEAAGLGNNAAFLRIMAAIGPEMGEDTPVGTQQQTAASDGWKDQVASLRSEKNALPERDPRRETLQRQINALYEKHTPKA